MTIFHQIHLHQLDRLLLPASFFCKSPQPPVHVQRIVLCVAGLPRNTENTPGVKTGTTTCRFDTQLFLIFIVSPSTSSIYEEMDEEE